MINISLSLSARDARTDLIEGSRTVVIDVLRATSVMLTALYNGAAWIRPAGNIEEAWEIKAQYPYAIMGGERDAVRIEGFDAGNSPLEYTVEKVHGRGIILSTTNGTKAIGIAAGASEVILAAFINLSSIVKYLSFSDQPVHLLCSGTHGDFSMDDFLCAGGIISGLKKSILINTDDLGNIAKNFWDTRIGSIAETLDSCKHVNTLKNNGFTSDLDYCFSTDTHPLVAAMATVADLKTGKKPGFIYPVISAK